MLSENDIWKFNRDHLKKVLLEFCRQDPDETKPSRLDTQSTEMFELVKTRLDQDKVDSAEWANNIFKESIETNISKRKLTILVFCLKICRKDKSDCNK